MRSVWLMFGVVAMAAYVALALCWLVVALSIVTLCRVVGL